MVNPWDSVELKTNYCLLILWMWIAKYFSHLWHIHASSVISGWAWKSVAYSGIGVTGDRVVDVVIDATSIIGEGAIV
jgi:hypothetical protein